MLYWEGLGYPCRASWARGSELYRRGAIPEGDSWHFLSELAERMKFAGVEDMGHYIRRAVHLCAEVNQSSNDPRRGSSAFTRQRGRMQCLTCPG
eukprot:153965-Pyramimonas_sp.AAC.1